MVSSIGMSFNFQNIFACHDHLQIFEESNLNRGIEVKSAVLAKPFTSLYDGATLTSKSISGSETAVLTMLLGAVVLSASAKFFKVSNPTLQKVAPFLSVKTSGLFCLPLSLNPPVLEFKFLILLESTFFLHGSH